jgi:hypothetical protein
MARPHKPPELNPSQPRTILGWSMQKLRLIHGLSAKQLAAEYGCSASHISRVEGGAVVPTMRLVAFYEQSLGGEGILWSQFWPAQCATEQARSRAFGCRSRYKPAAPGDASTYIGATVPNGQRMQPGEEFVQTWMIRNAGRVRWSGRRLERQGPCTGPGLISSLEFIPIPDTDPGADAAITVLLKAPTYDCTSIAYFKMVDAHGFLCFPDSYMLGLDVVVTVDGQQPDEPVLREG